MTAKENMYSLDSVGGLRRTTSITKEAIKKIM
jgi:hypothetical protein